MTQTEPQESEQIVVVKRWTRHGKDRAYVSLGEVQVGYRDLQSGAVVCDVLGHETTIERATAPLWKRAEVVRYAPRHASVDGEAGSTAPAVALPVGAPAATARSTLPDRDLATNPPAAEVRAQAKALRDAAPVRTRVARVLGVKTDERNWRIGGDAEEAVAKRLAQLGLEWRVLHAIPIGDRGSDIDHVVIGPAGVFTINAKHHPDANVWVRGDTVKVNGCNQPYVRNSRFEAQRASKLLTARAQFGVDVHGLIAVMGAQKGFTVVEQPRDGLVTVVTRKRVADHLRSLPVALGSPSIDRIYRVARHLATWQPETVAWSSEF